MLYWIPAKIKPLEMYEGPNGKRQSALVVASVQTPEGFKLLYSRVVDGEWVPWGKYRGYKVTSWRPVSKYCDTAILDAMGGVDGCAEGPGMVTGKNSKDDKRRSPKIPKPDNWDEVYRDWKNKKIKTKEALRLTGLKEGTFYNFVERMTA